MKRYSKRYWLAAAGIIILFYLFWGPLFPWSPLKIGYTKITTPKADLYISDFTDADSIVYRIGEIIEEEEKFHNLKFADDFRIIVLNKNSNLKRYLPWLEGSGYSVSLSFADLIYIGPNARRSLVGIEPFLKHELSHLLIDQNTSFENALLIHEQGWLAEGIAEYYSGHSFFTKDEFLKLSETHNYELMNLNVKNPLDMSLLEMKLNYTHYKFFVEFLINNYGIQKFQNYLQSYLDNPQNYKLLFTEIYGTRLDNLLEEHYSFLY